MTDDLSQQPDDGAEPEFYTEPPKMGLKDTLGVVLALVALVVIGYLGYVWLTPGMTITGPSSGTGEGRDVQAAGSPAANSGAGAAAGSAATGHTQHGQSQQTAEQTSRGGSTDAGEVVANESQTAAGSAEPTGAQTTTADNNMVPPHRHDHDMSCAFCGMYSDKSLSHVVASWSNGSHTHHDSWDCLFNYGKENGLTLGSVQVAAHGGNLDNPQWLDAGSAYFRYGTNRIQGSMPPFVAAFASRDAAESASSGLGGEVVDFAGLKAQWE